MVLIGAVAFDDPSLPPLRAVRGNVDDLRAMFVDDRWWGLPKGHCVVVRDPRSAEEMAGAVEQAADEASDLLLIYYAGHGLVGPQGDLRLAHKSTARGKSRTAMPYDWIREALLHSRAGRRVVILDCCFSGRALGMSVEAMAGRADIEGTYLLAAAAENVEALAAEDEPHTAFTGELISLLRHGVDDGPELLSLAGIYQQLRIRLAAKGRPLPQSRDRNEAGKWLLFPNVAYGAETLGSGESGPGTEVVSGSVKSMSWPRRLTALAVVIVSILVPIASSDAGNRTLPSPSERSSVPASPTTITVTSAQRSYPTPTETNDADVLQTEQRLTSALRSSHLVPSTFTIRDVLGGGNQLTFYEGQGEYRLDAGLRDRAGVGSISITIVWGDSGMDIACRGQPPDGWTETSCRTMTVVNGTNVRIAVIENERGARKLYVIAIRPSGTVATIETTNSDLEQIDWRPARPEPALTEDQLIQIATLPSLSLVP